MPIERNPSSMLLLFFSHSLSVEDGDGAVSSLEISKMGFKQNKYSGFRMRIIFLYKLAA